MFGAVPAPEEEVVSPEKVTVVGGPSRQRRLVRPVAMRVDRHLGGAGPDEEGADRRLDRWVLLPSRVFGMVGVVVVVRGFWWCGFEISVGLRSEKIGSEERERIE